MSTSFQKEFFTSNENSFSHDKNLFLEYDEHLALLKEDLFVELHGYGKAYPNDEQGLKNYLQSHGIRIANLSFLKWIWGKIIGTHFIGLSIGSVIDLGNGSDKEVFGGHEGTHKLQYDENARIDWLPNDIKSFLGFIVLSFEILQEIHSLKKRRLCCGMTEAAKYAVKNNSIELEAFFGEGNINHLLDRDPFAYKQYKTQEGKHKAMLALLDADIQKIVSIKKKVLDIIALDHLTSQDLHALQKILLYLEEEKETNQWIRDEYGHEERDLFADVNHPRYGRSLRLESQRNREKRLPLLMQCLEKEGNLLRVLQRHKEVKIISSQHDMEWTGVMKIQVKPLYRKDLYGQGIPPNDQFYCTKIAPYFQKMTATDVQKIQTEYTTNRHLLDQLLADDWIQELAPQMFIDWVVCDDTGLPIVTQGTCIKVSLPYRRDD